MWTKWNSKQQEIRVERGKIEEVSIVYLPPGIHMTAGFLLVDEVTSCFSRIVWRVRGKR